MKLADKIIDESIDGILALNTRLEVIAWNKACEATTGIKKESIINRNIYEFFPEKRHDEEIAQAVENTLKGYRSFVPYRRDHNNTSCYVEYHFIPLKDDDGEVIGIFNVIHDVAHRVKKEDELNALNKSLENFKRIIESAHDAILTFDASGNVTYWNGAAEKLFGYTAEEMLGNSVSILIPEDKRDLVVAIMGALQADVVIDQVIKQVTNGGKVVDVAVTIFPLKDEHNNFIGGCKIAKDLTDLLKYQQNIEILNKELTGKNRQLASVNSELKTFTNIAVNNYSETLRQLYLHFEYVTAHEASKLSDPGKANIRKAQAAIQKMKLLTNDIIAFTRLHEFDTVQKVIDLNTVLRTVIDDFKDNSDINKAKLHLEPLPEIKGYPFLVSMVFHHVLENAVKFRKDKTQLAISVTAQRDVPGKDIDDEQAQAEYSYDIISITDNGIGFPMEKAAEVFKIFVRLDPGKYKGSGIGLAICKKAMELHGGFITAKSAVDEGTTFHCYFPIG